MFFGGPSVFELLLTHQTLSVVFLGHWKRYAANAGLSGFTGKETKARRKGSHYIFFFFFSLLRVIRSLERSG
jgi:hypothetical protein